jgi:excinuclease ABC subunit A
MPKKQDITELSPRDYIIIKGARVNNLKNIDVAFQRNKLTVVTGLSGSGKSSLAFDTLYAEGQRMYVESLSSYARQFLGRMEKPEVDYIKGVSPAIAIEQRVNTTNPRSTVGTTTEVYDYLKLLFARAGTTISPTSGIVVKKDSVEDATKYVHSFKEGQKVMVFSPLRIAEDRTLKIELDLLLKKGFTRVSINDEVHQIEAILEDDDLIKSAKKGALILIDRAVVKFDENNEPDEDNLYRISDSVQTAFFESDGSCIVDIVGKGIKEFSDKFELDGILFEEPSVNLFTFNNPYGACKTCEGFGKVLGLDIDLVIPDKSLSVFEGAIAPWRSERMSDWLAPILRNGIHFDFPIHRAYKDLSEEEQQLLWTGNEHFKGINSFFEDLEKKTYKVQYRVMLSRYRGKTVCPDCRGTRLRKDASYVKIDGHSITDIVLFPIKKAKALFEKMELDGNKKEISKRIFIEIKNRLRYLDQVGLGYLTLNRLTSSLSGGEFQRIKLATSLGSALVGSMYILDEPSIGLHPRDTQKMVEVLKTLRDIGNTVIVVEHEEEVMQQADEIIDIGPDAGNLGGELVFQGTFDSIKDFKGVSSNSHTINFLSGNDIIKTPDRRRKAIDFIKVSGATENNLKEIDVKFPLGILCVVTGVSGSGKSTLVRKILYPALSRLKGEYSKDSGKHDEITGSLSRINQVEMVDQNPIGKSSRSNPVTYIKAYDAIRALMSDQPLAKQRDYKPAFFSFNVDGGRCEACAGEGEQTIEMQFMADVKLTCESCKGKRFKQEVLEVQYLEKNISDILNMTVDEAIDYFETNQPKLYEKLLPLQEVGLGYIKLGQSSNTLSGGEAQRVKLAFFLGKGNSDKGKTLFIFDEPTTGLHFHDIQKLLKAMNDLIEQGDSVIIIEHNMEVIKSADWIIDLGPEGGDEGGFLCFEGTPEEMVKIEGNYTADFLKGKI